MPALDTDDAMREFVAEFGLEEMVQTVDDDGDIWSRFGVRVQPAWAFVGADGQVGTVYGGLFDDALAERIEQEFGPTGSG